MNTEETIYNAMLREAARRTECNELRKDLVQQAWLEILEKDHPNSLSTSDIGHLVKTKIVPSMSRYFWANQCVVTCKRQRKGKKSFAKNVEVDVIEVEQSKNGSIEIDSNNLEELSRRAYCEYQIIEETKSILRDREFEIIKKRYLSDKKETRKVVSVSLGISPERVRQIETEALGKLRSNISYQ